MKRFALFAGDEHYPSGGWGDHQSSHDTLEEAILAKATVPGDWFHVVDLLAGRVVYPETPCFPTP